MAWNRTSLVYSVPMPSWTNGNAPASYNVGNIPSIDGNWQNCVLTNMGIGDGFVNPGAGLGYLGFDGVNDIIICDKFLDWTNASKRTFEFKVLYGLTGDFQLLAGDSIGANYILMYVFQATRFLYFQFGKGAGFIQAIASTQLTNGEHTIHFMKDGATLKIFIDGVEVAYSLQQNYNYGTMNSSLKFAIGNDHRGGSTVGWNNRIYTVNVYDDAISQARITENAALGNDMGVTANNVGDVLTIAGGSPIPMFGKKLIQRN